MGKKILVIHSWASVSLIIPNVPSICPSNWMIPIRWDIIPRPRYFNCITHVRAENHHSSDILALADNSVAIFLHRSRAIWNFEESIQSAADDLFVAINTVVAGDECWGHWIAIARAEVEIITAEFRKIDVFEQILDRASATEIIMRVVKVNSTVLRDLEASPAGVFCILHFERKRASGEEGRCASDIVIWISEEKRVLDMISTFFDEIFWSLPVAIVNIVHRLEAVELDITDGISSDKHVVVVEVVFDDAHEAIVFAIGSDECVAAFQSIVCLEKTKRKLILEQFQEIIFIPSKHELDRLAGGL